MAIGKEEREAVLRVMDRGILSGYQGNWSENFYGGPEIKALEKEWAEYFGVKYAIACNSATSGLWMACNAIGLGNMIKPDYFSTNKRYEINEIIVTPYSMTCSASMPLLFGAKPVFADIEEDYYCLDPKSVEERITERTKAIIVVDLFGQPYDADAINEIAERKGKEYGHKIYVIEDAAQAAGAKYKGKYAGTLGDIGVYSLNVHKPIQCGEGGIVVTNDDELAFRLRLSMNHSEAVMNDYDFKKRVEFSEKEILGPESIKINYNDYNNLFSLIGMNLRMTELSAAIAREQLKKLESILEVYRENAKYFPVKVREECESSFYRYAWNGDYKKYSCDKWDLFNAKNGYIEPIFKMPLFKQLGYNQEQCPNCQKINKTISLAWLKNTP